MTGAPKRRRSSNTPPNAHVWPLGALAELIDAASADSATVHLSAHIPRSGDPYLSVLDEGRGLSLATLRARLHVPPPPAQWHRQGAYATPWQAAALRLCADVLILSKLPDRSRTVALLSRTRLADEPDLAHRNPAIVMDVADLQPTSSAVADIIKYTPCSSFESIDAAFQQIPTETGTLVILNSLRRNQEDGQLELDLASTRYDIVYRAPAGSSTPASNTSPSSPSETNAFYDDANSVSLTRSLRAYLELLYIRPSFRIFLRKVIVRPRRLRSMLWGPTDFSYSPRARILEDGTPFADPGRATIRLGFDSTAGPADFGMLLYCRGRLIRPYLKLGLQTQDSADMRVVGIVEAEFLTPTPNMQSFERDKYYQGLMFSLDRYLKMFWASYGTMDRVFELHGNDPITLWVLCDDCGKWRIVSTSCTVDPKGFSASASAPTGAPCLKWTCSMNRGGTVDCRAPEDEDEPAIPHRKRMAVLARLGIDSATQSVYKKLRLTPTASPNHSDVHLGSSIGPSPHPKRPRSHRALSFPATNLPDTLSLTSGDGVRLGRSNRRRGHGISAGAGAQQFNSLSLRSPSGGMQEPVLDLDGPTPELFPRSMLEFGGDEFSLSRRPGPGVIVKRGQPPSLSSKHLRGSADMDMPGSNTERLLHIQPECSAVDVKSRREEAKNGISASTGNTVKCTDQGNVAADQTHESNEQVALQESPRLLHDARLGLSNADLGRGNTAETRGVNPAVSTAEILKASSSVSQGPIDETETENAGSLRMPPSNEESIQNRGVNRMGIEGLDGHRRISMNVKLQEPLQSSLTSSGTQDTTKENTAVKRRSNECHPLNGSPESEMRNTSQSNGTYVLRSPKDPGHHNLDADLSVKGKRSGQLRSGFMALREDADIVVGDLAPFIRDATYSDSRNHSDKDAFAKGKSIEKGFRQGGAARDGSGKQRSDTETRDALCRTFEGLIRSPPREIHPKSKGLGGAEEGAGHVRELLPPDDSTVKTSMRSHLQARVALRAASEDIKLADNEDHEASAAHLSGGSSSLKSPVSGRGHGEQGCAPTDQMRKDDQQPKRSRLQNEGLAVKPGSTVEQSQHREHPVMGGGEEQGQSMSVGGGQTNGGQHASRTAADASHAPEPTSVLLARRQTLFSYSHRRSGASHPSRRKCHQRDQDCDGVVCNQQTRTLNSGALPKSLIAGCSPRSRLPDSGKPETGGNDYVSNSERQGRADQGRSLEDRAALPAPVNKPDKAPPPMQRSTATGDCTQDGLRCSGSRIDLDHSEAIKNINSQIREQSQRHQPRRSNVRLDTHCPVDIFNEGNEVFPGLRGEQHIRGQGVGNPHNVVLSPQDPSEPSEAVAVVTQAAASAAKAALGNLNNDHLQKENEDFADPRSSGMLTVSHLAFSAAVAAAAAATATATKREEAAHQADSGRQSDGRHSSTHSAILAQRQSAPSVENARKAELFKTKLQEVVCLLAPGAGGGMASWMNNLEDLDVEALCKQIQERQEEKARDKAECEVHQEMQSYKVSEQIACERLQKVRALISVFLEQVVGILRLEEDDEPVESQLEEYLHMLDVSF